MTVNDHGGGLFALAREAGKRPGDYLDFSASINPLGMPAEVHEALLRGVEMSVHYPDYDASPLREALAAYHGVEPGEICPGNGSTELIYLLPRLISGDRALIVAPAFSEYAKAVAAAGWKADYLCLDADGFRLDLPALAKRLGDGFALLFLCNPGNPTGRLYLRDEIAAVAEICRAYGTVPVIDEAFIDFCGEEASSLKAFVSGNKGIVLRSMTKFYAIPGLRLGYAAASSPLCERLAQLRGPWSVNALAQEAGLAALTAAGYRRVSIDSVTTERARLYRRLSALPGLTLFEGAANYLLLKLENGHTAFELRQELLSRNIIIRDCGNFCGLDSSFFRVAVRSPRENDRLADSITELVGLTRSENI